MKKALLFILLFLSLSSLPASGWYIGGEGGYALNFMSTVTTWQNTEYRPGHGAEAAFIAEYSFDNGLALTTGARYIGKSFVYYHKYQNAVPADYLEMNHFLEIPVTLRYAFKFNDISLYLGAGGYIGIWFLSQWFGKAQSAAESVTGGAYTEISSGYIMKHDGGDNLFEAGLLGEIGLSWYLENDLRLDFSLRYDCSLTSLVKGYQENTVNRYNDTLMFTVGCLVPIGDVK